MGYARTIKESDLTRLKPLFDALETLPEGEGISYTGHPIQISKDRTIIYTYFDIHNLKGVFRMENPEPEELKITRPRTFTSAVDSAIQLSQFTSPPAKAKRRGGRTFPGFAQSSAQQQSTHQPIDWDKKYGKEPAEEAQEAQPPAASEGSGIEFYNQHGADKTFAEFHPLVMASREAGDLSELEKGRAFDEHQRVHGMPSEGGDSK